MTLEDQQFDYKPLCFHTKIVIHNAFVLTLIVLVKMEGTKFLHKKQILTNTEITLFTLD